MDLMTPTGARDVRGFFVYSGGRCVMQIEDRPGNLISVAAPSGPLATHPWLHAISRDPTHEHRLRGMVAESADFDAFCERLVAGGYDLLNDAGELFDIESGPHRVMRDGAVVGALFSGAGQFSTLAWQPEEGQLVFGQAVLTVYDREQAVTLFEALDAGGTYDEIATRIVRAGFTIDA